MVAFSRSCPSVFSSLHASTQSLRSRLRPSGGRLRLIATITGVVVLLDAATKGLATQYLAGRGRIEVLGGVFNLQLYRNFAGPNDIFPGHTELISLFAILALIVLLGIATRVVTTTGAVAVGLVLGGAIGNLLDRLLRGPGPLRGGVVDWLKVTDHTNSMNIADLAIDAAVGVLLVGGILTWWRGRQSSMSDPPRTGAPAPDRMDQPPDRESDPTSV